jgi:hypothetical protein
LAKEQSKLIGLEMSVFILPEGRQVEGESWQDVWVGKLGGVGQQLDGLVGTINFYGAVFAVDEPAEAYAVVDIFLHFGLSGGQAIGGGEQF